VSPRSKVEIARSHLGKAQEEAFVDESSDAINWSFAALEAAIDALSEVHSLPIEAQHWKRTKAARALHQDGVLPKDLAPLHEFLNDTRKAVFYDGEEPNLEEYSLEDILVDVEIAVEIAEAESK
jgi:hypothetical protein